MLVGGSAWSSAYTAGAEGGNGVELQVAQAMGGGMMGGPAGGAGNIAQYSEVAPRDLESSNGRVYAENCTRCHALPNARRHTAQEWPAVVARMQSHASDAGITFANAREVEKIEAFLKEHASEAGQR